MFFERDREGLKKVLLPVYDSIKEHVAQFQFHLPDSTSFLRLHKPEKFGDSLKEFRFTVNEANAQKVAVAGIEEGVAGYGLRVVVPMFYLGNHIGSVEYGNDFGIAYLDNLKSNYNMDAFLYRYQIENGIVIKDDTILLASTIEKDSYQVDNKELLELSNNVPVFIVAHNDKNIGIILIPNVDFHGQVSSYTKMIYDRSDVVTSQRNLLLTLLLMLVVAITIVFFVVYISLKMSLKNIDKLVIETNKVSEGDFTHPFEIASKDEVGVLSDSFKV